MDALILIVASLLASVLGYGWLKKPKTKPKPVEKAEDDLEEIETEFVQAAGGNAFRSILERYSKRRR